MSVNLEYYALLHEVRSYADLYDVSIELKRFESQEEIDKFCPHAYMTPNGGRVIVLLHPEGHWSKEAVTMWRGYFYHEMGHFDSRVLDDYQLLTDKNIDSSSFFASVLNCFSDYKQEKMGLGDYRGRDMTLSTGQATGIKRILDSCGDYIPKIDGKSDVSISLGILYLSAKCREGWQPDVTGLADRLYDMFPQIMKDRVKQMLDASLDNKCDSMSNAEDMYQLSRDVLKIFESNPNEEEEKAQEQPQNASGGQQGEDEGEDEGEGKGEPKDKREQDASINWRDLQVFKHDAEGGEPLHKLDIDYEGCDAANGFELSSTVKVEDYVNNIGVDGVHESSNYISKCKRHGTNTSLSSKIRKLLLVKTQSITLHGQKKGKISAKSMYKVPLQSLGAARERVFKKKVYNNDLDTAVSVLVDFSGSMSGERMEHAIVSALMLNSAISKIGVPIEIIGFTERSGGSVLKVLKTFTKRINNDKLLSNCAKAASSMGCNADGEAILWTYNRLARQPNKKKLMVVLSDGQPASHRGYCAKMTEDVVRSIERGRVADIYGIGIQSNSVKHFYKNTTVIQHAEELENALLTVIKNGILNI